MVKGCKCLSYCYYTLFSVVGGIPPGGKLLFLNGFLLSGGVKKGCSP